MSRKYSSWASNQPIINPDLSMMRLTTVVGNEQDQRKYFFFLLKIGFFFKNLLFLFS